MMKELFEKGYKIIVGSPYGDFEVEDVEDCEEYGHAKLSEIDDETKVVYFYDKIWD